MNFGTFLWYPPPLCESCLQRRASREAGWCLSWKAAHKPNVKHHLTHSTLHSAFTPGCRQGAQCADGCPKSFVPLVPIFLHAQEKKKKIVEKMWWHMDLLKRKEKSRETRLSTGQGSFTSMPWVGKVGMAGEHWAAPASPSWQDAAPHFPSADQQCPEQELLGMPAAKAQPQRGSRDAH